MVRYYVIAALIVVAVGSALFARQLVTAASGRAAASHAPPPSPHPGPNAGFVTTPAPSFAGQGTWVLSALPACFDQLSSIEGPSLALAFHVPAAATRIAPGTTLHRANCTVLVRAHDVWVYRGRDRLRIPPEARLFATREGLTLVSEHAGRTDVRVYRNLP